MCEKYRKICKKIPPYYYIKKTVLSRTASNILSYSSVQPCSSSVIPMISSSSFGFSVVVRASLLM